MDYEYHDHEDCPSDEGAKSAAQCLLVEDETDRNRANYLGHPIDHIVQSTSPNIEQGAVEFIEFWRQKER